MLSSVTSCWNQSLPYFWQSFACQITMINAVIIWFWWDSPLANKNTKTSSTKWPHYIELHIIFPFPWITFLFLLWAMCNAHVNWALSTSICHCILAMLSRLRWIFLKNIDQKELIKRSEFDPGLMCNTDSLLIITFM